MLARIKAAWHDLLILIGIVEWVEEKPAPPPDPGGGDDHDHGAG